MMTTQLNLRRGESAELARRRLGMAQADVADVFGVSVARVRDWERGKLAPPDRWRAEGALRAWEWCWLQRRRAGWTLQQLSDKLGLAVSWLSQAERGEHRDNLTALVGFWEVFA